MIIVKVMKKYSLIICKNSNTASECTIPFNLDYNLPSAEEWGCLKRGTKKEWGYKAKNLLTWDLKCQ